MGHKDGRMIATTYNKWASRAKQLRESFDKRAQRNAKSQAYCLAFFMCLDFAAASVDGRPRKAKLLANLDIGQTFQPEINNCFFVVGSTAAENLAEKFGLRCVTLTGNEFFGIPMDIACNPHDAFVYAKMCRLLVVGFIKMPDRSEWVGTKVEYERAPFNLATTTYRVCSVST